MMMILMMMMTVQMQMMIIDDDDDYCTNANDNTNTMGGRGWANWHIGRVEARVGQVAQELEVHSGE